MFADHLANRLDWKSSIETISCSHIVGVAALESVTLKTEQADTDGSVGDCFRSCGDDFEEEKYVSS